MKIVALGGCCSKSQQNYENAKIAAKNCGITDEVMQEKDVEKIMAYGVMATPALVIDNKVVSMGRMLTVEQIEKIIKMKQ
ncbi:MAG: thioredoxin family protein [Clostridia bacterium]|nr:thioredoxin family protein [Clostridia bacterium]